MTTTVVLHDVDHVRRMAGVTNCSPVTAVLVAGAEEVTCACVDADDRRMYADLARIGRLLGILLAVALIAAGCDVPGTGGEDGRQDAADRGPKGSKEQVASELVIEGEHDDGSTPTGSGLLDEPDDETATRERRDLSAAVEDLEEPPELLDDGTIDDGDDLFDLGNAGIPLMPIPIEDDPLLTEALDTWERTIARGLELIDPEEYDEWIAGQTNLHNSTRDDSASPSAPFVVRVLSKRCGGARTTATGVIVGDELVVTTVHAIESVERRVRVQLALDATERHYPAMIQYLDVDDDIAVLRVPGLEAPGIDRFADMPGPIPSYGFALGISDGGRGVRNVPIVIAGEELSAMVEQPDGLSREITDRDYHPMLGGISNGFSGGPVVLSAGDDVAGPWRLAGLVRARVPYRAHTGSIVIPIDRINEAISARNANPEWSELVPRAGCAQWAR